MTRTITEYTTTNEARLVLRPQISNIRDDFRNVVNNRFVENNPRLPSTPMLESVPVIDRETIIELNNSTSSERRIEFMENIINHQNNYENRAFLIENSSPVVRTYLHQLLLRSASDSTISEEDLYRIGNIFLYIISNLEIDGLILRDIIQDLRESMVVYNTNRIFSILDIQVNSYNHFLDSVRLASEEQLNERVHEFNQEIDQRIELNRRRVLYTTIGVLGSMALSSMGMPPIGGLLVRSLTSSEMITSSTQSVEEVVRLRDVWDASLKRILNIIQK